MSPPAPPPNTPQPTTFSSLLPLTPVSNPSSSTTKSYTYTVQLSDLFCIGTVPNGGYITSAFLHCARTHMTLTHPKLTSTDPINLHLQFLRRTSAGPATFTVRELKLGSRISNLHLTLTQHVDARDQSTPIQVEVEGYIVLTSLVNEKGLSHDTGYALHPPVLPVDLVRLAQNKDINYIRRRPDPYGSFRRATLNIEMYLVRPDRRPPGSSPAIADQWVRFCPLVDNGRGVIEGLKNQTQNSNKNQTSGLTHRAGRWTNDALGFLVDIFPQLNERYLNAEIEDAVLTDPSEISDAQIRALVHKDKANKASANNDNNNNEEEEIAPRTFWYPTLLLNLDVKKALPETGVEWLFVRVQAKRIEKGRFDLAVEVWDVEGDLVALSTHASLIVDAARNITRKPKRKEEGKSKI